MAIPVFYSYEEADEDFQKQLEKHLELLRRQKIIDGWSKRKVDAGENWREEIKFELEKARIIILLVSPDFLASDYCYETETIFALERHEKGLAKVVPIIIRPCMWTISNFKDLPVLPEGEALTKWDNSDEAWLNVSEGIYKLTQQLLKELEAKPKKSKSLDDRALVDRVFDTNDDIDDYDKNLLDNVIGDCLEQSDKSTLLDNFETLKSDNASDASRNLSKSLLSSLIKRNKSSSTDLGQLINSIPNKKKKVSKKDALKNLVLRFLRTYDDWYFSAERINKWGAKQIGFEKLDDYSLVEITKTLNALIKAKKVLEKKSNNGNSMFKLK